MWVSQSFLYHVCLLFSYCIISFHFLFYCEDINLSWFYYYYYVSFVYLDSFPSLYNGKTNSSNEIYKSKEIPINFFNLSSFKYFETINDVLSFKSSHISSGTSFSFLDLFLLWLFPNSILGWYNWCTIHKFIISSSFNYFISNCIT